MSSFFLKFLFCVNFCKNYVNYFLQNNRVFSPHSPLYIVIFRYFGNISVNIITIKRNHLTTGQKSAMICSTTKAMTKKIPETKSFRDGDGRCESLWFFRRSTPSEPLSPSRSKERRVRPLSRQKAVFLSIYKEASRVEPWETSLTPDSFQGWVFYLPLPFIIGGKYHVRRKSVHLWKRILP